MTLFTRALKAAVLAAAIAAMTLFFAAPAWAHVKVTR
jgi:hypothetical protein